MQTWWAWGDSLLSGAMHAATHSDRAPLLPLAMLCLSTVLLVAMEQYGWGALAWMVGVMLLVKTPRVDVRRRLGILFGAVAVLAIAPIHTDRSTAHFLELGACFAAVVFVPTWLLRRDQAVIEWRLWPKRLQRLDLFYTAISIPLAWCIIRVYFFVINPELPSHWPMPMAPSADAHWRLFIGINAVGIWDELFFVNTVYGILRSLYPARIANGAQAVVYTAVLYDMAFTGIGPLVVYAFALTQGAMYERSRCLLYVLIVHLIVDAFLVAAILEFHYPAGGLRWLH
ncbi:MAG: hypothetical protein O3B24_01195 [Verrucomicrobia bacterium]|nr:hypothetical protein [Verrucomicrobiota bacterium]